MGWGGVTTLPHPEKYTWCEGQAQDLIWRGMKSSLYGDLIS